MTIKTYKSSSVLSFSITMPAGNYRRIRFTPFSWGGGVYVTADEKEQEVLESLPEFGNRYHLVSAKNDKKEELTADSLPLTGETTDNGQPTTDEVQEATDDNIDESNVKTQNSTLEEETENDDKIVDVADFSEAKEYLMENFGYKSGQLRSKKAIAEAAEKNGIVFRYA